MTTQPEAKPPMEEHFNLSICLRIPGTNSYGYPELYVMSALHKDSETVVLGPAFSMLLPDAPFPTAGIAFDAFVKAAITAMDVALQLRNSHVEYTNDKHSLSRDTQPGAIAEAPPA